MGKKGTWGRELGVDLGTASILIWSRGKGIVLREPSVAALDRETGKLLAVGEEAQKMLGRTPENIVAVRPLREGVIADAGRTEEMLRVLLRRAAGRSPFKPRAVICVPSGITDVEEQAVVRAGTRAGARQVLLIEEPLAAAIGAGLDVSRPEGCMVVDIGGGTTDAAVLSLGGVAVSGSVRAAGDRFDEAVVRFLRHEHELLIGERTAEELKRSIGWAVPPPESETVTVMGRCLRTGLPRSAEIGAGELSEALREVCRQITELIRSVLERTPPELAADVAASGILLTGGGSLLRGMEQCVREATGIETRLAEDPVSCVAIGAGRSREVLGKRQEGKRHK